MQVVPTQTNRSALSGEKRRARSEGRKAKSEGRRAKSEERRAKSEERRAKSELFHLARNGFVSRSSPMVVSGPCPGTTMVSSGSASTGPCNDRMIFSYEPPGKSVRPIEPANNVSPARDRKST